MFGKQVLVEEQFLDERVFKQGLVKLFRTAVNETGIVPMVANSW